MTEQTDGRHAGKEARLLDVQNLVTAYPVGRSGRARRGGQGRSTLRAVDDVSFEIRSGETLGLVGESGSGKSTVARTLMGLTPPTAGTARLRDDDLFADGAGRSKAVRRDLQMVFQDPYSSLNPRMTVGTIVAEPLRVNGYDKADIRDRVRTLLELVGLKAGDVDRYPYQFSGGQCQRIGIARALALEPSLVIADEPVSALDVSVQAQIINLLRDLQSRLGLAYLFIAHDLAVVRHVADRVAVMYLGRIVETGNTRDIFATPAHPYTKALLSAEPRVDGERASDRIILQGDLPSPLDVPSGCRFRNRCWLYAQLQQTDPEAAAHCEDTEPPLSPVATGAAACHYPLTGP